MSHPQQPNFNVGPDTAAIKTTDYDNMSSEDLAKLINAAHKIRTGHSGNVSSTHPTPQPKKYVDLDQYLGG